ncbi:MAG: hypothetical protein GMKNLPBB_00743 [Myxococcota bacterium]|nr:hypothetical protein [Myxococcota bacterium]
MIFRIRSIPAFPLELTAPWPAIAAAMILSACSNCKAPEYGPASTDPRSCAYLLEKGYEPSAAQLLPRYPDGAPAFIGSSSLTLRVPEPHQVSRSLGVARAPGGEITGDVAWSLDARNPILNSRFSANILTIPSWKPGPVAGGAELPIRGAGQHSLPFRLADLAPGRHKSVLALRLTEDGTGRARLYEILEMDVLSGTSVEAALPPMLDVRLEEAGEFSACNTVSRTAFVGAQDQRPTRQGDSLISPPPIKVTSGARFVRLRLSNVQNELPIEMDFALYVFVDGRYLLGSEGKLPVLKIPQTTFGEVVISMDLPADITSKPGRYSLDAVAITAPVRCNWTENGDVALSPIYFQSNSLEVE